MKIKLFILLISNLIIMLSSLALADTIILKDGTVLQGIMKSAEGLVVSSGWRI